MKYICLQIWAPLRKENNSSSEMVSSLIFGETCTVIDSCDDWLHVKCDYDGYEGCVHESYIAPLTDDYMNWTEVLAAQSAILSHGLNRIPLSAGSYLPGTDEIELYNKKFKLTVRDKIIPTEAWQHAKGFLYTPYLWGGRSHCGIDCSGLTQIVFKIIDKKLPRDSSQQIEMGEKIDFENSEANDLAFFEKNGKITHVGIVAPSQQIVHASGRVRMDDLTTDGIVNSENGKLTHQLAGIRRI